MICRSKQSSPQPVEALDWSNPQPGERVTIYSTPAIIVAVDPPARDADGIYIRYRAKPLDASMVGVIPARRYIIPGAGK